MTTPRPFIDHDACTLCGKCVEICSSKKLAIENRKLRVLDDCILCGQCYAVCKFGAVSFDSLRPRTFKTIRYGEKSLPARTPSPLDLAGLLGSRRSIRHYSPKEPSREIISDLLECASLAPSAHNNQQWEFLVIRDKATIASLAKSLLEYYGRLNAMIGNTFMRKLAGIFMGKKVEHYYHEHYAGVQRRIEEASNNRELFFYDAPALIIVHSSMDGNSPLENAQYAAYNICLMAHSMGLGTCFIGYASYFLNQDKAWKKRLGIPAAHGVHAVLTLGYPVKKFVKPALRKDYPVRWM